ncbi:arabinogalactan O-methyltransferase 2 [Typha latifolia]|uniref:arabinogalactan O-methyltransferase 2 n=1 Tax=Typha latifolia TaxID=4733 RepID=UPI003C2E8594
MPTKKLIILLLIIFSTISFIRLLILTTTITISANRKSIANSRHIFRNLIHPIEDTLTPKEQHLLRTLVSKRAPCNLLIFGLNPQYLELAKLNIRGTTIFLEDDIERLRVVEIKGVRIHLVEYHQRASEAYELLKYARALPDCRPVAGLLHESNCKLALTALPEAVYSMKWDVLVVDGPSGGRSEELGRMATIYTAAMIARSGNTSLTDVFVHNVDRTIEKWYSREFLCDENLVSSKGRFWHFRIKGRSSSDRFCSQTPVRIQ